MIFSRIDNFHVKIFVFIYYDFLFNFIDQFTRILIVQNGKELEIMYCEFGYIGVFLNMLL